MSVSPRDSTILRIPKTPCHSRQKRLQLQDILCGSPRCDEDSTPVPPWWVSQPIGWGVQVEAPLDSALSERMLRRNKRKERHDTDTAVHGTLGRFQCSLGAADQVLRCCHDSGERGLVLLTRDNAGLRRAHANIVPSVYLWW